MYTYDYSGVGGYVPEIFRISQMNTLAYLWSQKKIEKIDTYINRLPPSWLELSWSKYHVSICLWFIIFELCSSLLPAPEKFAHNFKLHELLKNTARVHASRQLCFTYWPHLLAIKGVCNVCIYVSVIYTQL